MTTYFEPSHGAFGSALDAAFESAYGAVDTAFEPAKAPELELTPPSVLDQSNLVDPVKSPPKQGWRKLVHSATRGRINPGGSKRELEEQQLYSAIRAPLRGDYRIACLLYTSDAADE